MQKIVGPFLLVCEEGVFLASVSIGPRTFGLAYGPALRFPSPYIYDSRKDG